MPVFNVLNGCIFLQRSNGSRVNVALKPEMRQERYASMMFGYVIMSNVMLDPDCTEDVKLVEHVSSLMFYPSPKIGAIAIITGTEESDAFDYADIMRLNGVEDERWSDFTLPKKKLMLRSFQPFMSDLKDVDKWCEKTDLPPYHIFNHFTNDRGVLVGLNVHLTPEETAAGKLKHASLLDAEDEFIDLYKTQPGPFPRGSLSKEFSLLDETQQSCVLSARKSGITIITGGPGTGKTKVSGCILREWSTSLVKWRATALAQHAVDRIRDSFSTHWRFKDNFANMDNLKRSTAANRWITHVLVDEMSMVNTFAFASMLRMFPNLTTLVLVGDVDQLDPVGCGRPYERLIQNRRHIRLAMNYRMREAKYTFVKVVPGAFPPDSVLLHPFRADQRPGSMTIHKAQGSEFRNVVLHTGAKELTSFSKNKKLVYTAVTRSMNPVVYVSGAYTPEAVERIMYGPAVAEVSHDAEESDDEHYTDCDEPW